MPKIERPPIERMKCDLLDSVANNEAIQRKSGWVYQRYQLCNYALELERLAKALCARLDRDKGLISTYPPIETWVEYETLLEFVEAKGKEPR